MASTKVSGVREGRGARVSAASLDHLRAAPAPYQTRTCAHCGHETTFVREDVAGSWYFCVECGRYA
jgi:hypothetical protein